jgi:hypothetical protein
MLSYAEASRIIRIYFGLVFLYPVHPVDPVRKIPTNQILRRKKWQTGIWVNF